MGVGRLCLCMSLFILFVQESHQYFTACYVSSFKTKLSSSSSSKQVLRAANEWLTTPPGGPDGAGMTGPARRGNLPARTFLGYVAR